MILLHSWQQLLKSVANVTVVVDGAIVVPIAVVIVATISATDASISISTSFEMAATDPIANVSDAINGAITIACTFDAVASTTNLPLSLQ